MITECNRMDCLRKFRKSKDDEISKFCGLHNHDKEVTALKDIDNCPYFVDKFRCYKTKQIITKHEEVYCIFDEADKDGIISGLSRKGHEAQERKRKFEQEHHDTDNMICPYCNHELSDCWEYEMSEYEDNDIECPNCAKTFVATKEVTVSYSSFPKKKKER